VWALNKGSTVIIFGHFHRSDWTLSIEIDPLHQKINIPLIQIHMLNLPSILQDFCWRCLWLGPSPNFSANFYSLILRLVFTCSIWGILHVPLWGAFIHSNKCQRNSAKGRIGGEWRSEWTIIGIKFGHWRIVRHSPSNHPLSRKIIKLFPNNFKFDSNLGIQFAANLW